ncbi:MAG: CDP-alcohol phosphatidyltransferase [Promethearchaeota archaeon CR_4]|nr:MAG: CDP-alcohol phosphatidyltransferase [Candidatus Lokiarchaeota archaeon CR_4]
MVLNRFRAFAERLSRRPVDFFVRHNITPNKLTLIGFGISTFVAFLFFERVMANPWLHWLIPTLFFIAGAFDAFDGSVARKMNLVTKYGGFLDSTLDRYSDAILILGMITGGYFEGNNYETPGYGIYFGFWAMVSALLISYIRSAAEKGGVDMKGVGFMERGERILLVFFAAMIYGWIEMGYGFTNPGFIIANDFFFWFLVIFTVLMNVTIVERVVFAIKNLRRIDQGLQPLTRHQKQTTDAPPATNK